MSYPKSGLPTAVGRVYAAAAMAVPCMQAAWQKHPDGRGDGMRGQERQQCPQVVHQEVEQGMANGVADGGGQDSNYTRYRYKEEFPALSHIRPSKTPAAQLWRSGSTPPWGCALQVELLPAHMLEDLDPDWRSGISPLHIRRFLRHCFIAATAVRADNGLGSGGGNSAGGGAEPLLVGATAIKHGVSGSGGQVIEAGAVCQGERGP